MRITSISIMWMIMFLFAAPASAAAQDSEYVYFRVDGNNGGMVYFSHMVRLPYSPDDVTYKAAGQEAMRRAKQNFVNAVKSNYNEQVYANSVSAIRKPSHMTSDQFEGERLDDIKRVNNIYNMRARIL